MTTDEILSFCLSKKGAYIAYPFGDIPICVKVSSRIFAQLYPKPEDYKLTLNCDIMTGQFYRDLYQDVIVRGYHCPPVQQPYFNTIHLNGTVPDNELKSMIDHSYTTVVKKLTKKVQKELASL